MRDYEVDPVRRRRTESSDSRREASPRVELATLRRRFREADERLANSVDELREGRITREQCLVALVRQQRLYDLYMSALLQRLGRLRQSGT